MGPLAGLRVIEMAGTGPVPMCAMLLSDLGATVLRIDRATPVELGVQRPLKFDILLRGRKRLALDLKKSNQVEILLRLIEKSDAMIEGFRPGVAEKLGFGPETCLARNPRLVYGRMTGWGQAGPLANVAGHDLNYIALTGLLAATGRKSQPPNPPLAVAGDFGGGSLYLAMGVLSALWEAQRSGIGQVVDAAVVDGASSLMATFYGLYAAGKMDLNRGENYHDSGAYFYDSYECADGRWISVAPLEERFYDQLVSAIGADPSSLPERSDRSRWPEGRRVFAEIFKSLTRDAWCELLENTDCCFAPVLNMEEAPRHPHNVERSTFVEIDGVVQPAPAPRFSRTVTGTPGPPQLPSSMDEALAGWMDADELLKLRGLAEAR